MASLKKDYEFRIYYTFQSSVISIVDKHASQETIMSIPGVSFSDKSKTNGYRIRAIEMISRASALHASYDAIKIKINIYLNFFAIATVNWKIMKFYSL